MYEEAGLVLSWLCGSVVNEGQPSGSLESAASSEEMFDKLTAGYGLLPRIYSWVFLFFLFLNFCENCINEYCIYIISSPQTLPRPAYTEDYFIS